MANTANLTLLQNIIWYAEPPVLMAVALGVWLRQKRDSFRFFLFYLLLVVTKTYSSLLISHWYGTGSWPYIYNYEILNYTAIGLTFFVLYEVLSTILTSGTWTVRPHAFLLISASILVVVSGLTLMMGHQYHSVRIVNSLLTVEVCLRYVQIAVLLLLFVLTRFFGFYWIDFAFGVTLGYAFYAALVIVNSEIFARWGDSYKHTRDVVDVAAYFSASCIWLLYAWKRPGSGGTDLPADTLSDYSQSVSGLIK